jgi:hypothetical protein
MITYTTKLGRTFSFENIELRTEKQPALIVFGTPDWAENHNKFILVQDPSNLEWGPAIFCPVTKEVEAKILDYMSAFNEHKKDILEKIGLLICDVVGSA